MTTILWRWVFLLRKDLAIAALTLLSIFGIVNMPSLPSAAVAAELEIEPSTTAFSNVVLSDGSIRVVVDYEPDTPPSFNLDNLEAGHHIKYEIYHDYQPVLASSAYGNRFSGISLQDLDSDGTAEIIVRSYSNGAHCCTKFTIYSWQTDHFSEFTTPSLNSRGGRFEDLNGDGSSEFISADDSFLYRFSSYADSLAPPLIYTFRNGELFETTREHPVRIRETIARAETVIAKNPLWEGRNGYLAGYVASKALVGEYEEGWRYMLDHYNAEVNPDYPAALRNFLESAGYL